MKPRPSIRIRLMVVLAVGFLVALRLAFPERHPDQTGLLAPINAFFALGLLACLLALAWSIGTKLVRSLRLEVLTPLESSVFAIALGAGVQAYGVFGLGLVGYLTPLAIGAWLAALGIWTHNEWSWLADRSPGLPSQVTRFWRSQQLSGKVMACAAAFLLLLATVQALSPPTDPDGLIHHLPAPKLFLELERISAFTDFVRANYPATVEMLFTIGMAFGSDTFAKLMHLAFAGLLLLTTYAAGRRLLPPGAEWYPVAIMLGMPIFWIWASLAYIDMGWAYFEFASVFAVLLWARSRQNRLLILAGMLTGLALGSKYLALEGGAAIGLWILWSQRRAGVRSAFTNAAVYGGVALLVASPWFLKNWAWFGNPVFPFFGSSASDLTRVQNATTLFDYLLLPWRLYADRERFVGVFGSVEFPSPFFLLAFLYPFVPRGERSDGLGGIILLRFVLWALISNLRFRYLLPALPGLSLMAGSVLDAFLSRRRLRRIVAGGVLGGMVAVSMIYSVLHFAAVRPLGVVLGTESGSAFLRREVSDYAAKEFIMSELPDEARVLMPWDGRTYYCDARCVPDRQRDAWPKVITGAATPARAATRLRELGVSHLLFSLTDIDYSILNDRLGTSEPALQYFLDEFRPACTQLVYRDPLTSLYAITCG